MYWLGNLKFICLYCFGKHIPNKIMKTCMEAKKKIKLKTVK